MSNHTSFLDTKFENRTEDASAARKVSPAGTRLTVYRRSQVAKPMATMTLREEKKSVNFVRCKHGFSKSVRYLEL